MQIKICLICLVIFVSHLFGQENKTNYPIPVPAGSTIELPKTQTFYWILKDSQYKQAVKIAMRHEFDSTKISLLKQKIDLYDQVKAEKDTIVYFFKYGYIHYRDRWEKTFVELEKAEIKASQRWLFFETGLIIGVLAIITVNAIK